MGHADAAMESIDFTTAVVKAIEKLLSKNKGILICAFTRMKEYGQNNVYRKATHICFCVRTAYSLEGGYIQILILIETLNL